MNCTPSAVSSTAAVTRNCRRSTKRTQSTDASDGRPSWQTRRNVKEHDGSHNQRGIAVIPRSRQAPARKKSPARIRSWQEADVALAAEAGPATAEQLSLAAKVGVSIDPAIPRVVAAAMLRVALQPVMAIEITRAPVERFEERLDWLRRDSDPPMNPANGEEATAWIEYLHLVRRREALISRELCEGDIVNTPDGELAEVSSISIDGRIYFKGGSGQCAWPDLVTVQTRADDLTAEAAALRSHAANAAAHRRKLTLLSQAKAAALSDYEVTDTPTIAEIDEFEQVISLAEDERPIQQFLENHQCLLTALIAGRPRYCLPKPRLGSEYVPDFLIAGVDSLGIHWVLVELETPLSGVYLKDGRQFDEKARKGISQIGDWRHWLGEHLHSARAFKPDGGLGLVDIRSNAPAIVMVGRRSKLNTVHDAARHSEAEHSRITVHTYDRLLDRLRGASRFSGPPGANPHLIHGTDTEDDFS